MSSSDGDKALGGSAMSASDGDSSSDEDSSTSSGQTPEELPGGQTLEESTSAWSEAVQSALFPDHKDDGGRASGISSSDSGDSSSDSSSDSKEHGVARPTAKFIQKYESDLEHRARHPEPVRDCTRCQYGKRRNQLEKMHLGGSEMR